MPRKKNKFSEKDFEFVDKLRNDGRSVVSACKEAKIPQAIYYLYKGRIKDHKKTEEEKAVLEILSSNPKLGPVGIKRIFEKEYPSLSLTKHQISYILRINHSSGHRVNNANHPRDSASNVGDVDSGAGSAGDSMQTSSSADSGGLTSSKKSKFSEKDFEFVEKLCDDGRSVVSACKEDKIPQSINYLYKGRIKDHEKTEEEKAVLEILSSNPKLGPVGIKRIFEKEYPSLSLTKHQISYILRINRSSGHRVNNANHPRDSASNVGDVDSGTGSAGDSMQTSSSADSGGLTSRKRSKFSEKDFEFVDKLCNKGRSVVNACKEAKLPKSIYYLYKGRREYHEKTEEEKAVLEILNSNPKLGPVNLKRMFEKQYPSLSLTQHQINYILRLSRCSSHKVNDANHPRDSSSNVGDVDSGTASAGDSMQTPSGADSGGLNLLIQASEKRSDVDSGLDLPSDNSMQTSSSTDSGGLNLLSITAKDADNQVLLTDKVVPEKKKRGKNWASMVEEDHYSKRQRVVTR